ncbi:hypothetical protein LS68_006895 [Helicobacter sp. MIT 05-5293]|uniref:hypothetical protein n=1 Tax=Helicobacter sp. MIT 05-5293 TaxID=1548149 RepID=UPI00051D5B4D|nr:hypothetical protein [Helicobacter sp. MIT 05-5293]TLD80470.1 hypothetical protein LS68_006895 [Helicobacter sp. MIT 05-5293]
MGDEIKTITLPPSCITSNNEPCPIQIEVDDLESADKELIKSNLFFMLSSMDSIITESVKYIEKGLPFYVRIMLEGKNTSKTKITCNIFSLI